MTPSEIYLYELQGTKSHGFLYDMLIQTFNDGDYFVGIFMWFIFLIVVGLALWGILYIINYAWRPVLDGYGLIIHKEFIPAHDETTITYDASSKMSLPHTTHYDDEWVVTVQLKDMCDECDVEKEEYKKLKLNDRIHVAYSTGRLIKSLYIKKLFI